MRRGGGRRRQGEGAVVVVVMGACVCVCVCVGRGGGGGETVRTEVEEKQEAKEHWDTARLTQKSTTTHLTTLKTDDSRIQVDIGITSLGASRARMLLLVALS